MMLPRTDRATQERNVPSVRLDSDADLRKIYTFGRKLGQGSFGVVYEATHNETQTKWAIKEIRRPAPGSSRVKMLEQEITILKQVNHAHIIHLQEVYDTSKMIYLVMELCDGGELKQLLQRKSFFTEDETRHIIHSLADAVVYLHKKNIVHRDLKLENILVEKSVGDDNGRINIKVTDFGLSVQTNGVGIEHTMSDACGTLIYMAPEMMSGRGYSQWCDIWSVGIIMYMLLCGESPFVSKTKFELLEEIMNEGVKFTHTIWTTVSDAAKNLLTCLLKMDPAYRMSASQLLENPWITGDTNMPALPYNVLEMMRNYLEESDRRKSQGKSSLTFSEETVDVVAGAASPEPSDCGCHTELKSASDSCSPPTSEKVGSQSSQSRGSHHQSRGSHHQSKRITSSETAGPQTTQPGAKQRAPQDKQDTGTGQKAAYGLRKESTASHMFMGKRLSADGPVKNLWLVEDADEVALKCLDFYKKPLNVKVKLMQSHSSVKCSTQPCTKQQKPQDKQDISAGQKAAPGPRKVDDQKPTTSVNAGLATSKTPQNKAKK